MRGLVIFLANVKTTKIGFALPRSSKFHLSFFCLSRRLVEPTEWDQNRNAYDTNYERNTYAV